MSGNDLIILARLNTLYLLVTNSQSASSLPSSLITIHPLVASVSVISECIQTVRISKFINSNGVFSVQGWNLFFNILNISDAKSL